MNCTEGLKQVLGSSKHRKLKLLNQALGYASELISAQRHRVTYAHQPYSPHVWEVNISCVMSVLILAVFSLYQWITDNSIMWQQCGAEGISCFHVMLWVIHTWVWWNIARIEIETKRIQWRLRHPVLKLQHCISDIYSACKSVLKGIYKFTLSPSVCLLTFSSFLPPQVTMQQQWSIILRPLNAILMIPSTTATGLPVTQNLLPSILDSKTVRNVLNLTQNSVSIYSYHHRYVI